MKTGFVEDAVEGALGLSLDRIRRGVDYGYENQRPELDEKQQAEFIGEQAQGRTDEAYRQSLEFHDFTWWPLQKIHSLPGTRLMTEGEWRNDKLQLAFTPNDLAMGFPGTPSMTAAEQFDRHIRDVKMVNAEKRGKITKAILRAARRRK